MITDQDTGRHHIGRATFHTFRLFGKRSTGGGRHRLPESTDSMPAVGALLAPVDARVALLEQTFSYIHVSVDTHFVPGNCTACTPAVPEITSVRVFGEQPGEQPNEVCMRCALNPETTPIRQAALQSTTKADIRVEVCA